MNTTYAYISTNDTEALEVLSKEGFDVQKPECVQIPRDLLNVVEELLRRRGKNLQYSVSFHKPEDRKKIIRGELEKYDSGWGPDPFHTIGD